MHQPPKVPLKLFRWFCSSERVEEIEGDLFEAYQDWRETRSKLNSNWLYWWTTIRSIFLHKQKRNQSGFLWLQIRHYFKTAWREINRHKTVASINLIGLSLGFTCCLLMGIYIFEQTQFDNFFEDKSEVYRLEGTNTTISASGNSSKVITDTSGK